MRLTKRVTKTFHIPDDPDNGYVEIKHLKVNEVKQIQGKVNNMSFTSDQQGNGSTKIDMNPYSVSTMMAHEAIIGWGGMKDAMGRDMSFDSVNLTKAAEFVVIVEKDGEKRELDFYGWIDECRAELAEEVKLETTAAEEN